MCVIRDLKSFLIHATLEFLTRSYNNDIITFRKGVIIFQLFKLSFNEKDLT
jgi:hypothetical protein